MSKPGTRTRTALRVALAMILILLVGWTSLRGVIHARDRVAPVEVAAAGVQEAAESGGETPSTDSSTGDTLPHVPRVVLIKLRPGVAVAAGGTRVEADGEHATLTTDAVLDDLLADLRAIAITPVFRGTGSPAPLGRGATDGAHNGALNGAREGAPSGVLTPEPDLTRWVKVTLPADADVSAAVDELSSKPAVAWAEPDYLYEFDTTPDDTYFGQQWHLHNTGQYHLADADIDAPEAWDTTTGLSTTIIAVIDTGIDRDHVDLDAQIWSNPGETPDNGVDDDNNGYVDDTWGWNWVSDLSDPDDYDYDDPRDDNGHGTHVAGIAAAETNNGTGVAGVCWNCKVMSLKAFEHNGVGTTSDIVQAIDYAADKGADVINMSFGSYAQSLLLEDTLAVAYGDALLVAAAGNGIRGKGTTLPFYPAAISFVTGVGASDVDCVERDQITLACITVAEHKARFSNYGVNADVCGPGVSIYSTYPGGYSSMAGTSMAAPVVAGIGALIMAENPTWSHELVRGQLAHTTDGLYTGPHALFPGEMIPGCGAGRVNGHSTLTTIPEPDLAMLTDSIEYADSGDSDGIADAGETVTVTMLLRNQWGEATNVTGSLSTSDAYVTVTDGTGDWGDISAYATSRNTTDPFVLSLHPDAPNNHQVSFTMAVTEDGGTSMQSGFSFSVQRGVEIPSTQFPAMITQSMTLTDDYLYIVRQNMLVPEGVTLTIEPGTRLQFDRDKFVKVRGTLVASGTEEAPIYLTSNQRDPQPDDFKGVILADEATDATLAPELVEEVAAEGRVYGSAGEILSLTHAAAIHPSGDVYFQAVVSNTTPTPGLFRWVSGAGAEETLLLTGDAVPGGGQFTDLGNILVTPESEVVFTAAFTNSAPASGVFMLSGGQFITIAMSGEPVPGAPGWTFSDFDLLARMPDSDADSSAAWVAFSAVLADGLGGSDVGVFVKREDVSTLAYVPLTAFPIGTVLAVTAVDSDLADAGPNVTVSGTTGVALVATSYYPISNSYHPSIRWLSTQSAPSPLGGEFRPEAPDRRYRFDSNPYSVVAVDGGSSRRALFSCDVASTCASLSQVLLRDNDPLPITGTLDLSGPLPLAFDGTSLVFGAVVSGTGGTTRLVRRTASGELRHILREGDRLTGGEVLLSVGPLHASGMANRFGELVALIETDAGARVVRVTPSDEYESGTILKHVVLEYGGGLLIEDCFPFLQDVTVRRCTGAVPTGKTASYAALTIFLSDVGRPGVLVVSDCRVTDNEGRGVFVHGFDTGAIRLVASEIEGNYIYGGLQERWTSGGAGLYVEGTDDVDDTGASLLIDSSAIRFNTSQTKCGGLTIRARAPFRLDNSVVGGNAANAEGPYDGGGGMCLDSGIIRGNVVSGNVDIAGHEPGLSTGQSSGSAMRLVRSNDVVDVQYNTMVGNGAAAGTSPRLSPGHTVMMSSQKDYFGTMSRNNMVGNGASFDLYLSNHVGLRRDLDATHNYWGTTDLDEIRYNRTFDYWNDFEPGEAYIEPVLTRPEPLAPGFLWQATIQPEPPVGQETMTITLEFSRPMTTTVQPHVTFGVVEPFTQHTIDNGDWISSTHWVGSYDVNVATGDGINTLRVADAEGSGGMVIPVDTRIEFNIQVAGTSSFELEGVAGLGFARLTYPESDLEDLAGYVIYRSVGDNLDYRPLETTLSSVYTDTAVVNGQTYWYQYKLLNTDFEEVAESNEIALAPDDFTVATTPVVTDDGATTNMFTQLHATWLSEDPETGVVEYQYCIGASVGGCEVVAWTSRGTTTEVTKTGLLLVDGQTYYFNVKARNGRGSWSSVGSSDGITVEILPVPTVTGVSPISGVRTESHLLTVTGTGFESGPTVRLSTAVLGNVTVVSTTELTAQVGANQVPAGVYDLSVANFDGQSGTLSDAYTVMNPPPPAPAPVTVNPEARYIDAGASSFTVGIDVSSVSDLISFQLDLEFDPALAQATGVTLGSFLGGTGRSTSIVGPTIDNTSGVVTFGAWSLGSASAPSGSGRLATITFEPLDEGRLDMALQNVQLRDIVNSPLPADLQDDFTHLVTFPFGDFDHDCWVTVADIMVVAALWDSALGDGTYNPDYDFDADGDIDIADITTVVVEWNVACVLDEPLQVLLAPSGASLDGGASFDSGVPVAAEATIDAATGATQTTSTPVRLRFTPGDVLAPVGGTASLDLWVEDAANLGGLQLKLTHDPEALEFVDVTPGPIMESTGNTAIGLGPEVDPVAGIVTLGTIAYGATAGPDGSGHAATIRFRVDAGSPEIIEVDRLIAVTMNAVRLPVAGGVSGIINIRPGDCNGDTVLDAGDISASVLEIFDGDGATPANAPYGTFPGRELGCNANGDAAVDAGDISCSILMIFGHGCR